jgi:hypothetical protein
MVYLLIAPVGTARRQDGLRHGGAFYVGFSLRNSAWNPAMLRGISRTEVTHLEESGRASLDKTQPSAGSGIDLC